MPADFMPEGFGLPPLSDAPKDGADAGTKDGQDVPPKDGQDGPPKDGLDGPPKDVADNAPKQNSPTSNQEIKQIQLTDS